MKPNCLNKERRQFPQWEVPFPDMPLPSQYVDIDLAIKECSRQWHSRRWPIPHTRFQHIFMKLFKLGHKALPADVRRKAKADRKKAIKEKNQARYRAQQAAKAARIGKASKIKGCSK